MGCWKAFSPEERQALLVTAIRSYRLARGGEERRSAEEVTFEGAVLRDFKFRFARMKTPKDAEMLEGLLKLGRESAAPTPTAGPTSPSGTEVKKSHSTFTLLWPVFQKAQKKAIETENNNEEEEEDAKSSDGPEAEDEDFINLFESIVSSFAGILSLLLAKKLSALCDGPGCTKEEETSGVFKKCGQCKGPHYCSRECQVAAWKQGHKMVCQKESTDKVTEPVS